MARCFLLFFFFSFLFVSFPFPFSLRTPAQQALDLKKNYGLSLSSLLGVLGSSSISRDSEHDPKEKQKIERDFYRIFRSRLPGPSGDEPLENGHFFYWASFKFFLPAPLRRVVLERVFGGGVGVGGVGVGGGAERRPTDRRRAPIGRRPTALV